MIHRRVKYQSRMNPELSYHAVVVDDNSEFWFVVIYKMSDNLAALNNFHIGELVSITKNKSERVWKLRTLK